MIYEFVHFQLLDILEKNALRNQINNLNKKLPYFETPRLR